MRHYLQEYLGNYFPAYGKKRYNPNKVRPMAARPIFARKILEAFMSLS